MMALNKKGWARPITIAIVAILVTILVLNVMSTKSEPTLSNNNLEAPSNDNESIDKFVFARNQLSYKLNIARREIGKLECEMSKGKKITSNHGGWCKDASTETGGQHLTDKVFVPHLSSFLKDKTVGSFGDGPGAYKREITKLQEVRLYDAYDGAPYSEENSKGTVKFLDLTIPQYGIPVYDWIISLEVAEHIPQEFESTYLDNIFRHAKEGIILSWAIPGQGGLQHVNNKPLEYVIQVMEKNGFVRNENLSKKLQKAATFPWLKRNINVYLRTNYSTFGSEKRLVQWFS
ncbi:unnamed protein product [Mytilus edulis]|uniref:Methyltransferase type 11 domain-containing protein n=1 Tax=Mytilus edulis TaxID=6550 RepID=A0A8S3PVT6_MYTED|nr:unnamed protein product [Mytilus edulis]